VTGKRVSWQSPCCLKTAAPSWSDTHLCQPKQQARTQGVVPFREHEGQQHWSAWCAGAPQHTGSMDMQHSKHGHAALLLGYILLWVSCMRADNCLVCDQPRALLAHLLQAHTPPPLLLLLSRTAWQFPHAGPAQTTVRLSVQMCASLTETPGLTETHNSQSRIYKLRRWTAHAHMHRTPCQRAQGCAGLRAKPDCPVVLLAAAGMLTGKPWLSV
jgi:hypothetical protein